jgi:hypothetical protein
MQEKLNDGDATHKKRAKKGVPEPGTVGAEEQPLVM